MEEPVGLWKEIADSPLYLGSLVVTTVISHGASCIALSYVGTNPGIGNGEVEWKT